MTKTNQREIGTHYAKHCDGKVVYYWGRGFGYRKCKGCGAEPDPTTREEIATKVE